MKRLAITVADHRPHPLHAPDGPWPETNCYTDLWIELLHALGCEPVGGLAFLLGAGFDGEQWEFFKYPPNDLEALYGVKVDEINVWQPVTEHIETHLALGNFLTVEVDAFYLPDTAGTSYGTNHQKTTIVVNELDRSARRIEYFHNAGYYALGGPDYAHVLREVPLSPDALVPYVERVDVSRARPRSGSEMVADVVALVRHYLARRPETNPVVRLGERVISDLPWLREHGVAAFHEYAFGTLRQCGAWAATTAQFTSWLALSDTTLDGDASSRVASAATVVSQLADHAKSAQFQLARAAAGREVGLTGRFEQMASAYETAVGTLAEVYGVDVSSG